MFLPIITTSLVIISASIMMSDDGTRKVKSLVDGKYYNVVPDSIESMSEVADVLAIVTEKIRILIDSLDDSSIQAVLRTKQTENTIKEAVKASGYTSYTIDKKNIYMCIRNGDTNQIEDFNTLMYVVIHELAHTIAVQIGHTDEFKDIFKYLASAAVKTRVYKYIDYSILPVNYCGLELNTNILS